jgi:hypothetical protein
VCLAEGDDYIDEYQVQGFNISNPYGKCPITTQFNYSFAVYNESGQLEKITGPDGDFLVFYSLDELTTAA